jgi:aspartate/methionine/tyrosine aminotransferase
MADENYYAQLRNDFDNKRTMFSKALTDLGFDIYNSGSAFYIWTRIPKEYEDAIKFNEMLMEKSAVGVVPGSAFADSDIWDAHVRICIAREEDILEGALERIRTALN